MICYATTMLLGFSSHITTDKQTGRQTDRLTPRAEHTHGPNKCLFYRMRVGVNGERANEKAGINRLKSE